MTRKRGDAAGTTAASSQPRAVEIAAEVRAVRTCADGTVNVTLNLPEYCMEQAQVLMGWVRDEVRAVVELA